MLHAERYPSGNVPFGWSGLTACFAGTFGTKLGFRRRVSHGWDHLLRRRSDDERKGLHVPAGSRGDRTPPSTARCWDDTTIGVCWNSAAPVVTAYEFSANAAYGKSGCLVPNPATSASSCSAGDVGGRAGNHSRTR